MSDEEIKKALERILFEIRWMQQNQNPPVNYFLVVVASIIASVLTVLAMGR